ncbi:enoyl-CoA hydratase/isomerase family protein [Spongiactinospora sp. TRM90649]|uniref:enoyl-CoA hydratase/isomerase family protein n=1 Tax=Spongiactinospora sp. TRM90649 TaxID=3031114 RepID=UPI0023F69AA1|nr:enoyl-CoA hydratase/isomerase family protein [Spongiactinospora sp. TRM90649]MDF5754325.1 enoyl-CoA hydratase/isomerase family protein [Spongiactinospora sp. TRM90649]
MSETTATERLVLCEDIGGGVARITLNRPAKRNAMSRAARSALLDALDACHGTAKVIVLTGAGPAFCAGVDLKEAAEEHPDADYEAEGRRTSWLTVQERIRNHPAIVIAAVNGFALGGGLTLINSSDLAIAAEDAPIGMPEVGFGLYPGLAGPSTQLRLGPKRAAWMVLTAEPVNGSTAAEWGLVNLAVPAGRLDTAALDLAGRIARHNAVTLAWAKRALREIPMHISDWTTALQYGESVRVQIQARTDVLDDPHATHRRAVGRPDEDGRG